MAVSAASAFAQGTDNQGSAASTSQIDPHFELSALNAATGTRIAPRAAAAPAGAYAVVTLPAGVHDPDGPVQYIDGPAWIYHPAQRGPSFEIAALGGGMYNAPFLAHVGVDWHF